jgi:MFS family permease
MRAFWKWLKGDFLGIFREFRVSYLPPLMVYFAAGVSSFTGIIESFFVKEELGLSAAFLAGLGFWAGMPWALKMPIGHMVDLAWRWKSGFVYLGAALMAASLLIMVGLTGYKESMAGLLPADVWYILSALLAPIGFMLQDVVADAMTVEAVPAFREDGTPIPQEDLPRMHVTMQTLGRIAIVGGGALVAGLGGWLAKVFSYALMYKISLLIPILSVAGVTLGDMMSRQRRKRLRRQGFKEDEIQRMLTPQEGKPSPNWSILGGSAVFVAVTLAVGLSQLGLKEEIILFGSLGIIVFLMLQLLREMEADKRREILGIAVIVFVFRAMPTPGAGAGWWQIDVLGFDEAFFGTLRQISAILVIVGMVALRGWMARRSVPYIVVFLSLYGTIMSLPYLAMFYGLHEWTEATFGFGARTIAIIDTMADSPLGQVAMIPMLAWIAREAPRSQKATYFAVLAAFTNLALSASNLATKYVNTIFVIERGRYDELGNLLICVILASLVLPVLTVAGFYRMQAKYRRGAAA